MADSSPLLPAAQGPTSPGGVGPSDPDRESPPPIRCRALSSLVLSGVWGAAFNTAILVPFFMGKRCPAIPTALPFAITYAAIGYVAAISRAAAGDGGTPPEAEEGELRALVKSLASPAGVLAFVQMAVGTFWGSTITLSNTHLFEEDSPETCEYGVYITLFIFSVLSLATLVLACCCGACCGLMLGFLDEAEEEDKAEDA